jgi:hypothetical protein
MKGLSIAVFVALVQVAAFGGWLMSCPGFHRGG